MKLKVHINKNKSYRKPKILIRKIKHLSLFAPVSLFGDPELLAACDPAECTGNFSSCNVGGTCFNSCCV